MANNKSNYFDNALVTSFTTTTAVTRPTAWSVSLHVGHRGQDGVVNEITAGGYSRQAATWNTPVAGVATNSNIIKFGPATASWGAVDYLGIWESSPGANFLYYFILPTALTVDIDDFFEFLAGTLQVSEL